MTMESKRAVIYARYSSSRQREESIERQIEICNDYAAAHNMLVIGSYVDRKKTGKTDTRRQKRKPAVPPRTGSRDFRPQQDTFR